MSKLNLAKHSALACESAIGPARRYKWDSRPAGSKPENGLLNLRSSLNAFANLRPCLVLPQLAAASTLKDEIVSGVDIMIVRELVGGIYFGQPRVSSDLTVSVQGSWHAVGLHAIHGPGGAWPWPAERARNERYSSLLCMMFQKILELVSAWYKVHAAL